MVENTKCESDHDVSGQRASMARSRSLGSNDRSRSSKPASTADALWRHLRRGVSSMQVNTDLYRRSVSFEDSVSAMRLQEQLRDAQRKLERERSVRTTIETKKSNVEQERAELVQ